jgi:hypothetical protein
MKLLSWSRPSIREYSYTAEGRNGRRYEISTAAGGVCMLVCTDEMRPVQGTRAKCEELAEAWESSQRAMDKLLAMPTRMNCPKCKGLGFKVQDVFNMDSETLSLKCGKANCGEWSLLSEWKQATAQAWKKMAEERGFIC